MSRRVFSFDDPKRFIAGTIGMPGERTFYLQAVGESTVTSVALEKGQVIALADRLQELLDEVGRQFGVTTEGATAYEDNEPLTLPAEEEFRVGAMSLGWDESSDRVVVESYAMSQADEGDDEEAGSESLDVLRVRVPAAQAQAFVRRARALVAAGRPPCPFCLQPLDPQGHICPRANGYRRRP